METCVLSFGLEVPFWCSFRDPTGINVHTTFRLPPLTTIYGLIANTLNLSQDDYSLRSSFRFAIGIVRPGDLVETYSKIMKIREAKTPEEAARPGNVYISTSVIKQKLIHPAFHVHILADRNILERVGMAMANPARPLYLGESDDVVDIVDPEIHLAAAIETTHLDSAIPFTGREMLRDTPTAMVNLPIHFIRRGRSDWSMQRRLYTYRTDGGPIILRQAIKAYAVGNQNLVFEPAIQEENP
jgi:CRISPR-associated protein Cas5h